MFFFKGGLKLGLKEARKLRIQPFEHILLEYCICNNEPFDLTIAVRTLFAVVDALGGEIAWLWSR